jgi:hypothetical protein
MIEDVVCLCVCIFCCHAIVVFKYLHQVASVCSKQRYNLSTVLTEKGEKEIN